VNTTVISNILVSLSALKRQEDAEMIILMWVVFSFAVAIAANANGRTGCGWFFISLIISPLFAILLVIAMPSKRID